MNTQTMNVKRSAEVEQANVSSLRVLVTRSRWIEVSVNDFCKRCRPK
ncbi:MAG: hypothetical protein Q8L39_14590 [Burkholderiales bacterium]|nr:hypothetical protein [Burkholderiales bacterium]